MLWTKHAQIYSISERFFFFWNFLYRTAIDAESLWKCRPTKPISSKVPYYLSCFFLLLLVVVSIASLVETHGLLQQARNDLVVWSEAHQEKWATKDHVLLIITQKNSTSHTQPEPGLPGGQSMNMRGGQNFLSPIVAPCQIGFHSTRKLMPFNKYLPLKKAVGM